MEKNISHTPDIPSSLSVPTSASGNAKMTADLRNAVTTIDSALKNRWEHSELAADLNEQLVHILSSGYLFYIKGILEGIRDQWQLSPATLKKVGVNTIEEMEENLMQQMGAALLAEYVKNNETVFVPFPSIIRTTFNPKHFPVSVKFQEEDETIEMEPILEYFIFNLYKNIATVIVKDYSRGKTASFESYLDEYYGYKEADLFFDTIATEMMKGLSADVNSKHGVVLFNMPEVRHSCLGVINALHLSHLRFQLFQSLESSSSVTIDNSDALQYWKNIPVREKELEKVSLQRHQAKRGAHRALSPEEIAFNEDVTVRLAGSDTNGNLLPSLDHDIFLFQETERILTQWLAPFQRYYHVKDLTAEQQAEIDASILQFHEKGGHAGMLKVEQIRYLMEHGVVLFIEKKVRDDVSIVLGTVSALTRTPCKPIEGEVVDPKRWEQGAHEFFPLYDMGTLGLPPVTSESENNIRESAAHRIFIARSSILHHLSSLDLSSQLEGQALPPEWEGKMLRRNGFAARGKIEILDMAEPMGRDKVAMNIGVIHKDGTDDFSMGNKSSTEHNSWVTVHGWRMKATKLTENVYQMLWAAHMAKDIKEGQKALTKNLTAKGWDRAKIQDSTLRNLRALVQQISEGRHEQF